MVHLSTAATLLCIAASAYAQSSKAVTCSAGSKCPDNLPCCSQYGQCGVGAYCLGGCDPLFSNSLDSCVPEPACQSKNYKFNSLDRVVDKSKYLGDASKADFVADGNANMLGKDAVLLTLQEDTTGTLLASTSYVWYGKVSARLKTSHGRGVVTAFILLSDVKDEIDFEFVGADLETAQSNYYFQGITDYDNEENITLSNTFENYHTYEIDWTPDQITWSIDGQVGRTKKKSETWNSTANRYDFPQTPARVQLSLWPAGLPSNGKGTVDWSGGQIQWDGENYSPPGYYYASVTEVDIQCYDPPDGARKSGSKSYIYDDEAGTNNTVEITGKQTVLKSLIGTGTNMSAELPKPKSSGTASSDASATSLADVTIPGQKGGGGGGADGQRGGGGSSDSSSGNSGSDSGSAGSPVGSSPGSATSAAVTGFDQGTGSGSGSSPNSAPAPAVEKVLKGSIFAAMVAMAGMVLL
ncbi:MAG: hypothetical protein M4579_004138 [Chaenotheca gracillima]|nr:MAG: hypothetical protein M4579_004138 [Chaenotheca gracillima]